MCGLVCKSTKVMADMRDVRDANTAGQQSREQVGGCWVHNKIFEFLSVQARAGMHTSMWIDDD